MVASSLGQVKCAATARVFSGVLVMTGSHTGSGGFAADPG
jgi:hypothetical protein